MMPWQRLGWLILGVEGVGRADAAWVTVTVAPQTIFYFFKLIM